MSDHGMFHWNELMTDSVEGAKAFYEATVGWSFDAFDMENGTYWVAMQGGKPAGGIVDMRGVTPEGVPPHWFSYLEVDDVDLRVGKVEAAGGQILRAPFDVPKVGRIAIVQDSTGAAIGLIAPASGDAE